MGHTANTAIGQGMVETTPLQLAMVAATIANGGKAYGPRLFAKDAPKLRADLLKEGYTKEGIELVRHGMWKTVEEDGTGKRAKISGIEVAGRTGTAQFWREITAETGKNIKVKDNHTWFIAFAPYKEPTLAICVFVQGAKAGGGVSAPIAGRILAEALASKTEPRVAPVKPAKGSFTPVDNVK
jgi:penicillin-binding protein 2